MVNVATGPAIVVASLLLALTLLSGCSGQVASVHLQTPLRAAPSLEGNALVVVPEDSVVELLEEKDGFVHVIHAGREGYLPACLTTRVKERRLAGFQARTEEAGAAYGRFASTDDPAAKRVELNAVIDKYPDTKWYAPALLARFWLELETGQGDPIATLGALQSTCELRLPDKAVGAAGNWAFRSGRVDDAVNALARPATGKIWVEVNKVALREAPSQAAKRVGTSSYGVQVELLGRFGGWRQVRSRQAEGWVPGGTLTTVPPLSLRREYAISGAGNAVNKIRIRQKGKSFTGELVNRNGKELALRGTVKGDRVVFKCPRRRGKRCNFKGEWRDGVISGELVYVHRGIFKNKVRLTPN